MALVEVPGIERGDSGAESSSEESEAEFWDASSAEFCDRQLAEPPGRPPFRRHDVRGVILTSTEDRDAASGRRQNVSKGHGTKENGTGELHEMYTSECGVEHDMRLAVPGPCFNCPMREGSPHHWLDTLGTLLLARRNARSVAHFCWVRCWARWCWHTRHVVGAGGHAAQKGRNAP